MQALEHKIPPPIIFLLLALLMAATAYFLPTVEIAFAPRGSSALVLALVLALVSLAIGLLGAMSLKKAQTTISPLQPDQTSSLVVVGIYRYTRNPMYLSLLVLICAWAVFLASPWAWCGPVIFVLLINRLQIQAEERVLQAKFGESFSRYQASVRRWI